MVECPHSFFREWGTPMPGFVQPLGHGIRQKCEEMRDPNYYGAGGPVSGPSDTVLRQWVLHDWNLGDQKLKDQAEGIGPRRRSFWSGWTDVWRRFS